MNSISPIKAPGWNAVKLIYPKENYRSLIIPVILSAVFTICSDQNNTLELIKWTCGQITSILPSILGFTLTGYALIIGLSSSDLIRSLAVKKEDNEPSMYQVLNATFAHVLVVLSMSITAGVLIGYLAKLNCTILFLVRDYVDCINATILFILLTLVFYSLLSVKDIVINVFNFGQYAQAEFSKQDKKNIPS